MELDILMYIEYLEGFRSLDHWKKYIIWDNNTMLWLKTMKK